MTVTQRYPFPTTPLQAIEMNWRLSAPVGTPIAMVNGTDKISSNTPEGVLRRFETWLKKHDAGADGKDVVLEVVGYRAIVLRPIGRTVVSRVSCVPGEIVQQFDVRLCYDGKEFENLVMDLQTCVWDAEKRVRKKKGKVKNE